MKLIIKKTTVTSDDEVFLSYLNNAGSFGRKKDAVILDEKAANLRLNSAEKDFRFDMRTKFEIVEA